MHRHSLHTPVNPVDQDSGSRQHKEGSTPGVLNLSSDDQIAEAKRRAMMYAQSLKESREQEAKAMKALEQERTKWIYDHEEKSIRIEQLERELATAVDAIEQQRSVQPQPGDIYSTYVTLPPAVEVVARQPHISSSNAFLPTQSTSMPTQSLYQKPLNILDQRDIQTDFRKVLTATQPVTPVPTQTTLYSVPPSSSGAHQPNLVYATIPVASSENVANGIPIANGNGSRPVIQDSETWGELLNQYKDQLQKARSDITHLMSEKKHLASKVIDLTNTSSKLAEDKEQLRIKITDLEARLQFRSNQVREYETAKLQREESDRETAVKLEHNQMTITSLQTQISILENENKIALQSITSLETQLNVSKQVNANLESKIGELQIQVVDKDYKLKQWETRLNETEEEYSKDLLEMKHALNTLQLQLARAEIMQIQTHQPSSYSPMTHSDAGETPKLQLPSQIHGTNQPDDIHSMQPSRPRHTSSHQSPLQQHHSESHHYSVSKPSNSPQRKLQRQQSHDPHSSPTPSQGATNKDGTNSPLPIPNTPSVHFQSMTSPQCRVPSQTSVNTAPMLTPRPNEKDPSQFLQSRDQTAEIIDPKLGIAARSPSFSSSKRVVSIPSPRQHSVSIDDSDLSLSIDMPPENASRVDSTDSGGKRLKKSLKKKGLHSLKSKSGDSARIVRAQSSVISDASLGKASSNKVESIRVVTPSTMERKMSRSISHDSHGKRVKKKESYDHIGKLFVNGHVVASPVAHHEVTSSAKKMTRKVSSTPTSIKVNSPKTPSSAGSHRVRSLDGAGKRGVMK